MGIAGFAVRRRVAVAMLSLAIVGNRFRSRRRIPSTTAELQPNQVR